MVAPTVHPWWVQIRESAKYESPVVWVMKMVPAGVPEMVTTALSPVSAGCAVRSTSYVPEGCVRGFVEEVGATLLQAVSSNGMGAIAPINPTAFRKSRLVVSTG